MKKTTKGALAAGAAGVLLLGGAGSLAYWSDSAPIDGGSVTSGTLALSDATCDADWVYAEGNAGAGTAVTLIVPGDTIAKDCTFTVTATGDNLEATLSTPTTVDVTSTPDAPSLVANVSAGYTIGGVAVPATITDADNGQTVTATIEVEFPFGTAEDATTPININDTQSIVTTLNTIDVTLTQIES